MNTLYTCFKAYDVRGHYTHLSPEAYYFMGCGLVELLLVPQHLPTRIVVGHDGRHSSLPFYRAFCQGFTDAGGQIIPLGLIPSELMYSGAIVCNCSGAMITASHNPKDDNGLKIVVKIPQMLGLSSGLGTLRDYVIEQMRVLEHTKAPSPVNSEYEVHTEGESLSKAEAYWKHTIETIGNIKQIDDISKHTPYTIVVDTANGMGGWIMERLKTMYTHIRFIPLYWEIDGTFPHHPADPMQPQNLVDLQQAVIREQADMGIAFDGDADRAFFVDENGESIPNELLCARFAQEMADHVHSSKPVNAQGQALLDAIVYVVSYARCVPDTILAQGCAAVPSKQGHTFVKAKMAQYNAVYGAEASGHHYFGEFGYMDSGALTVALGIKTLVTSGQKASELVSLWSSSYFVSGEINKTLPAHLTIDIIRKYMIDAFPDAQFWVEDGITVYYPEWKVSIRTSNTEPLARFNVETQQQDRTKKILSHIFDILGISE